MIKTRRFSGPSLTPMIDVVFLLLLFFLLSSQFKAQQAIEIEISTGISQAASPDIQLIELGERTRLNGIEMTDSDFIEHLKTLDPIETTFAIRSEQEITFGDVVKIMDAIRRMGFENIVLVENTNEN